MLEEDNKLTVSRDTTLHAHYHSTMVRECRWGRKLFVGGLTLA